ncbi:MAG: DUF2442 domain-containing protein [Bacteroidaceae bacterium]|nr:DUF2442 domain-containing protein [Bacteroidaceae bacterium]
METISRVWCDDHRIFIETSQRRQLTRPMEAFPRLKYASPAERNANVIGRFGDDIRWEALDEDIHISSFYETSEPNPDNEVGRLFRQVPQLSVAEMAKLLGIQPSLLDKYIYGIKRPGEERMAQIREAMHSVGRRLLAV